MNFEAAKRGTRDLKSGHNVNAPIDKDAKVFRLSKMHRSVYCKLM